MSVAIVAMVNHTAIHPEDEIFDDECPDSDFKNNTHDDMQDGEFEWSTKMQGWILSSFFYGYVLTQVNDIYFVACVRARTKTLVDTR
jgi:hypothetical protein